MYSIVEEDVQKDFKFNFVSYSTKQALGTSCLQRYRISDEL